jgi:hypothetical protein
MTELKARAQQNTVQRMQIPRGAATSSMCAAICWRRVHDGQNRLRGSLAHRQPAGGGGAAIAPLLGLNEGEVYQKLLPRYFVNEEGKTNVSRVCAHEDRVPPETWEKVQQAMTNLSFPDLDSRKSFGGQRTKFFATAPHVACDRVEAAG